MAIRQAVENRTLSPRVAVVVLGLSPTGMYAVREAVACGAEVYGYSDIAEAGATSCYLTNSDTALPAGPGPLAELLQQLSMNHQELGVIPTTDRSN